MLEVLFDPSNDPILYAAYISLCISIMLKLSWHWILHYRWNRTALRIAQDEHLCPNDSILVHDIFFEHPFYKWIKKMMVRKDNPFNEDNLVSSTFI